MKAYFAVLLIVLSFALMSCSREQGQTNQENANSPLDQEEQVANTTEPALVPVEPPPECSFKLGFDVWEPYQYVDVNGDVRGMDIELVTSVIDDMGCTAEFVQGTWVSLLEDLRNGDVDMLLGASKTEAREKFAYFSVPYRMEEFSLYIRMDDQKSAAYANINEFIENGSRIGVVGDYFYGPNISALIEDEQSAGLFVFGIMGELNIARLLDMDIDVFIEDNFVGASLLRRKALGELIVEHGYTIKTGNIYVMFGRASVNEQQVSKFNLAMDAFKSSDKYSAIVEKYDQ